jgi:hypothetical protein
MVVRLVSVQGKESLYSLECRFEIKSEFRHTVTSIILSIDLTVPFNFSEGGTTGQLRRAIAVLLPQLPSLERRSPPPPPCPPLYRSRPDSDRSATAATTAGDADAARDAALSTTDSDESDCCRAESARPVADEMEGT